MSTATGAPSPSATCSVGFYKRPSVEHLSGDDPVWPVSSEERALGGTQHQQPPPLQQPPSQQQLEQQVVQPNLDSSKVQIFSQVTPGQPICEDPDHMHVMLCSSDASAPARNMREQGNAYSDRPPRLLAADALVYLEPVVRKELNAFMSTAGSGDYKRAFGPFRDLGDVAYTLEHLQRKGEKNPAKRPKAEALERLLRQFCQRSNRSYTGLLQLPALFHLNQRKCALSRPMTREKSLQLRQLVQQNAPDLLDVAEAVMFLLGPTE